MKKSLLILFALFIGLNVFGQRRRSMSGIPNTQREPTEQEIAKREREIEERKAEFINNFITTLEADDFQKEIIKQYVTSYFEAKIAILKTKFQHRIDRDEALKHLEDTHFADIAELISESDMVKIKELMKGDFKEKEVVKEKKKKRKSRKRNKGK
ncbi:MAG: hypothetical protein HKN40_01470 [Winogradskyella sp.]|uniref:hypothetical protein n=1 Tax=Winogradskyella sp. TaxID=1883156 RepID=UPI001793BF9F|nr:hypothetical protein [Winogradskyella sp.]